MTTTASIKPFSIAVRGYPVRESESKLTSGDLTITACRWFNHVTAAVHARLPGTHLPYAWLNGRFSERVRVTYRFQGISGDPAQYVQLTRDAIASALRLSKRSVLLGSVTCEPGEPGVWLEIRHAVQKPAQKGA